MVNWTILVIGSPPPVLSSYFEKHALPYKIIAAPFDPFQCHTAVSGYDFILCWAAHVVPTERLTKSIAGCLDFTKINVTWDSYGRNFPHKTRKRWSRDLIGLPAAKQITDALCETQEVRVLPKDMNVSDGYFESDKALLRNVPAPAQKEQRLAKHYNPTSGRYE